MSRRAWFYVVSIIIAGAALSGLAVFNAAPDASQQLAFAVFLLLGTAAQVYNVRVPGNQSYHANVLVFFAGVLLLHPALFVLLVIIPHTIEWAKERVVDSPRLRDWYLQPFNMATHIIAGSLARWIYIELDPAATIYLTPVAVLAVTSAALSYVAINHLIIGQALVLARRVSWRESGVLELENLLIDLVLLLLGYVVAVLWRVHPWLVLPALSPVVLIYRALMVPQLQKEAQTDEKTGLCTARHFMRLFTTELERAKRFGRPLALIMADLDLLRNINNTYGHLAGDAVLAGVGQLMRSNLRSYDIVGRFGGEEFCIVLPEAGSIEAREVAERIRQAIASHTFEAKTTRAPIRATMSFGVACFPADAPDPLPLIHQADLAVYQAKLKGRNRVEFAVDVPHSVKLESPPVEPHVQREAIPVTAARLVETTHVESVRASPAPPLRAAGPAEAVRALPRVLPQIMMWSFVAGVCLLAALATGVGLVYGPPPDVAKVVLLSLLAIIAQLPQMKNIYGDSSVSVSVAIIFAAGLISGVFGVAVVSATVVIAHRVQIKPVLVVGTIYKTAFNWAAHVLAGLAPVAAISIVSVGFEPATLPLLALPTIIAGFVYYIIETGLIAGAISLSDHRDPLTTWRERYSWLVGYYVALSVMGLFLAAAYTIMGAVGLVVFVLPVLMMAYAQKQFIDRTQQSVRELQRMNKELTRANQEVTTASIAIRLLNDELFHVLAKILDARDPYVSNHAAQVAEYATAIANELKLPPDRIERVRQAAFLHDIGKIGISEQILHKPAKLTPAEYTCVKTHVQLGADFLDTCHGLRHLVPAIKHHHEWWNGNGYPGGLRGEAPPIEARILALSDAVEAMASDRPYHRAMSLDQIILEIERFAGVQFDPSVVEAFVRVATRRGPNFVVNSGR